MTVIASPNVALCSTDKAVVTSGADAWQILQENDHLTLAILDSAVPDVNGIELCRRLRQG